MDEIAEIELSPLEIFDHNKVLQREIDEFKNNFEKNQRYKEFDGLIRRNHRIYEAMDCNLLPVLQSDVAKEVADKLNKTCERLEHISSNRITERNLVGVDLATLTASDIARLAESVTRKPVEIPHMATIVECDTPRVSNEEELMDVN